MHARRNPNGLSVTATAYSELSPSITSATFLSPTVASRRGLLARSPPPSPSLPSLIPRHGKKPSPPRPSRVFKRWLVGLVGVVVLMWLILRHIYAHQPQLADVDDGEEWEMVGTSTLPQEISAIAVQDARGNGKWTISIPPSYDFPLRPAQYQEICRGSMELSKQLRADPRPTSIVKRMLSYYAKDQYYIDVQEAEEEGLLPASKNMGRPKSFVDDEDIAAGKSTSGHKVCERSLTYVMETGDAGFGATLMRLWMSYGLAVKEKRAFFIDDTRWPYGKYSTYFTPPPATGCLPPPPSHMVPCPHSARHIVVSDATVKQTFGQAFNEEFEDGRKMRVQRQHKIFALLRTGYETLFHLRPDDADYVSNRTETLYAPLVAEGGTSVGVHIRRGDKHPYEYQYQKDYIPIDRYVSTARSILAKTGKKEKDEALLVLATDDAQVYESPDLAPDFSRAQDRIILATKAALEAAQGHKNPWIDEITGWEGGFYRDVFFSLGQPVGNANDIAGLSADHVPDGAMKLREFVGRAYLLDLAVLGKADYVVCTVSSIGCRILAVMQGWDRAIGKGAWRNVDGDFDWRGVVW